MAKHKLQIFLDHIAKDFSISTRDKLVFNLIIRLGLSASEIMNLKLFHVNLSPDLFRIIVPGRKKDTANEIIIKRTKETSIVFDLLAEYLSMRKNIAAKYDNFFLSLRLQPFHRNVINKAFQRYKKGLSLGDYNTENMRLSSLNILSDPTISQVRLIEIKEIKDLEQELKKKKAIEPKELVKINLIDRDKEINKIKSVINNAVPSVFVISAPLGGGKTSLVNFAKKYAEEREIPTYTKTFYQEHKNFQNFFDLYNELTNENVDFTKREVAYEKITWAIFRTGAEKRPLFLIVEDIHHACADSINFLRYLLKSFAIDNPKTIILLTIENKEEHQSILDRIDASKFQTMPLPPLSHDSISFLGRKIFKNKILSKSLVNNIWGLSGGNPHYITQVLNYLKKNKKNILRIKHNNIYCSSWDVPGKIEDLEKKKIQYLDIALKRILLIVSIFAKPCKKDVIANIEKKLSKGKTDFSSVLSSLKKRKLLSENEKGEIYPYHETLTSIIFYFFNKNEIEKVGKAIAEEKGIPRLGLLASLGMTGGGERKESSDIFEQAKYLYKIGSFHAAIDYFDKALKSSKQKKAILGIKQKAYQEIRQRDKAIECTKKVDSLENHINLAEIYFKKYNYESALVSLDKAKEIALKDDNKSSLALIYLKIGKIFNKKTNFIEGAKVCNKGLDVLPPMRKQESGNNEVILDPRLRGDDNVGIEMTRVNLLNELGLSCTYLRQHQKAKEAINAALNLAKKLKNKNLEANAQIILGMTNHFMGDNKQAISHYKQAQNISEQTYNKHIQGIAIMNIGVSFHTLGDLNSAINNYSLAENIFDLMENHLEKTNMLVKLAIMHASFGNFKQAFDFSKEALTIAEKNRYKLVIPAMQHLIGACKRSLGDVISAEEHFTKALHNFENLGRTKETCLALFSQAECYLDFNRFTEATERSQLALNLGLTGKLKDVQHYGYLLQAQIEVESGAKNVNKISELLDKANRVKDFKPLHDHILLEKWLTGISYKLVGKNKEAEKILDELDNDIDEFSKTLPAHFQKAYKKSREKYFELPSISMPTSSEDFVSELISERGLFKNSSQILESLAIRNESLSILKETVKSAGQIKKASAEIFGINKNNEIQPILGINNKGEDITDISIPNEVANYVITNGLPMTSLDWEEEQTKVWQCFPIKNFEENVGVIFLLFDKDIPKLSEVQEIAFKNLLSITGIISNKLVQDEKNEFFNKERQVLLKNLEALKKEREAQPTKLVPKFKKKSKTKFRYNYNEIIGESTKLHRVFDLLDRVTESDISILITGESGTGKELVARATHFNNPKRKDFPFLTVNCAALPETLLESELFGHKKGSFTGAFADKIGLFEEANNGSIFLDEIGEMSLSLQTRLLRVLQNGEIRRVGDVKVIMTNARVISATNKDLEEMVRTGAFREDLFYRLNTFSISMPPLRKRKKDLPLLVNFFINKHGAGKNFSIDKKVIEAFKTYKWPGNVRELENAIIKFLALSQNYNIGIELIKDDKRFIIK